MKHLQYLRCRAEGEVIVFSFQRLKLMVVIQEKDDVTKVIMRDLNIFSIDISEEYCIAKVNKAVWSEDFSQGFYNEWGSLYL